MMDAQQAQHLAAIYGSPELFAVLCTADLEGKQMTTPAQNISKISDFGNTMIFRANCSCLNQEHDHTISIDIEDDMCVSITISQDLEWCRWGEYDVAWPKRIWRRVRDAIKFVFTGYVKVDGYLILDKEQGARDYANALLKAADELERRRSIVSAMRAPIRKD